MKAIGMTVLGMAAAGLAGATGAGIRAGRPGTGREGVLYVFLAPGGAGAPVAARRAVEFARRHSGEITLRPVLLVDNFDSIGRAGPQGPLEKAVRELEKTGPVDIPLCDEEGLRLAELWKVDAVPAFVLVREGRAHRTAGDGADLEGLLVCPK